jgi:beta-galactosidase
LAHWVEPHPNVSGERIAKQTDDYLKNDVSINFYMVHGGTNFGFTSGANYDKNHDIQPDLTSYDYDAPISEAGWVTPKYNLIREVIRKYVGHKLPEPPAPNPVIEIPSIKLDKTADFFPVMERMKSIQNSKPLTFEQMNQGYGYVLYSYHINQPVSGTLEVEGLRDYALVYVDGEKVGELNRYFKDYSIEVNLPFNSNLQILVENMGRINYGADIIHNNKGIISPVILNGTELEGEWSMTQLPMDKAPLVKKVTKPQQGLPAIYQGTFNLTETGDTFIDMSDWGKGIIFINGINIGRYWKLGPQQTLYIPGVWLKKGANDIVIFEQQNDKIHSEVHTVKVPVLRELQAEQTD